MTSADLRIFGVSCEMPNGPVIAIVLAEKIR
jgi:hypothetical protein